MSRGGKEEIDLPLETQGWVSYSATKRELENYKKFVNQLLNVVKCSERGNLLWLNKFPDECKEEHFVRLLNTIRELVKQCPKKKK